MFHPDRPRSVLIVDDRHEVLELNRILLGAEGYETEGCAYSEATPGRLQRDRPDVLLLDLLPRDDAPWSLLRRLRQDTATRGIGVVVTADAPDLVDRALRDTSLDVAAGLVMPFDIEALYAAIAAAARLDQPSQVGQAGQAGQVGQVGQVDHPALAGHPALATPVVATNPLLGRAATLLRQDRARILLRWVQRLSTLDVFRDQPDLPLTALYGQGAALLDGVAIALELQSSSRTLAATTVGGGVEAAHAHARLRRGQGVRPGNLAREMAALRREVWRAVRGQVEGGAVSPSLAEVWDLLRRVDAATDEALAAMLDGWIESEAGRAGP